MVVLQALSKALMDLRADMVTQAEDEVRANADQNSQQVSVQKLVKMETKQLEVLTETCTLYCVYYAGALSVFAPTRSKVIIRNLEMYMY